MKQETTPKRKKSIFKTIINIISWILILGWAAVCLTDYFNVQNSKEPQFCIKKGTKTYADGDVEWCTGAGYKIYKYNRTSYKATEYGPFWIKERSEN